MLIKFDDAEKFTFLICRGSAVRFYIRNLHTLLDKPIFFLSKILPSAFSALLVSLLSPEMSGSRFSRTSILPGTLPCRDRQIDFRTEAASIGYALRLQERRRYVLLQLMPDDKKIFEFFIITKDGSRVPFFRVEQKVL